MLQQVNWLPGLGLLLATSAVLIVLLPGCFPDERDGNTGDNGLSDEDKKQIDEEAEQEGEEEENGSED